mgnify:CR=1 FL=1
MNYCRKFISEQIVKQNSAEDFSDWITGDCRKNCKRLCRKRRRDRKKVVKILFALILVSQILLGIDAISDVIERRK